MPFDIRWYIPHRVIYINVHGELTLEDLRQSHAATLDYIAQGQAPVHIISDTSAMEKFPHGLNAYKEILGQKTHPNTGWVVTITHNQLQRLLANMTTQIAGGQQKSMVSFEDALDFLQRVDLTLSIDDQKAS